MNEHDDEHGNIEKRLNNLEKQLKTLEMTEASGPPVGTVSCCSANFVVGA
jgi:hypothetical protein